VKEELSEFSGNGTVRLMFQDEAGFGRINKPKYCWCYPGFRPTVPCHHIREYRYAYGAAEPMSGESFFLVLPHADTVCMNIFLCELSKQFQNDRIVLVCDGAGWHTTKKLEIPENIRLVFLPPATPEMNPIEQIWKEIRKIGFRNEIFSSLNAVVDRLCEVICSLSAATVTSIMARKWIIDVFN
jgi:putative transposase